MTSNIWWPGTSPTPPVPPSGGYWIIGFDDIPELRQQDSTEVDRAIIGGYWTVGDNEGQGEYWVNPADITTGALFTGSITGTVLTVLTVASGSLHVGDQINSIDGAVIEGTYIISLNTGTGGVGTYNVNLTQNVPNASMTSDDGANVIVAFDGARWYFNSLGDISVKQYGAFGDTTHDDSFIFLRAVPKLIVPASSAPYLINQNTTITADLDFTGGQITVPVGVTLTINGQITAKSKIIFLGAGTVIINKGIIDVAWFDGTDANTKTAFCFRGIQNTNGTGKTVAYYPPSIEDSWATVSANNQWGLGWKVTAPILVEQAQTYTIFLTYSSFIATVAMNCIWSVGAGATKADGLNFPIRLKTDGGNGLAQWGMRIFGSSHTFIPYAEMYYSGGIYFSPNGVKQCSDIQVGFLDTGALYNQAILMEGAAGVNCTISDIEIGMVNSTGFVTGHAAAAVVQLGSNCNGISVRKVNHRVVVSGFVDATTSVVLITNTGASGSNAVSSRYGMNIGPIINGSTTPTAEALVVADGSSGASAKFTGVTIESGSECDTGSPPGGSSISLNYTSGAIVQGLPGTSTLNGVGQKVSINSTCQDTRIYGVLRTNVLDTGVDTLIDGHNYGAKFVITNPGSGVNYTNTHAYFIYFQTTGATAITGVIYTRSGAPLNFGGYVIGTGSWILAPGDSIAVSYTGTPNFTGIPM